MAEDPVGTRADRPGERTEPGSEQVVGRTWEKSLAGSRESEVTDRAQRAAEADVEQLRASMRRADGACEVGTRHLINDPVWQEAGSIPSESFKDSTVRVWMEERNPKGMLTIQLKFKEGCPPCCLPE